MRQFTMTISLLLLMGVVFTASAGESPLIKEFAVEGVEELAIELHAGKVFVRGTDTTKVRIEALRTKGTCNIEIGQRGKEIFIKTKKPRVFQSCVFKVMVQSPKKLQQTDVVTGAGDIFIKDLASDFDIKTGSGEVAVDNTQGNHEMKTGSGDLRGKGTSGKFDLKTGSGDIVVEGRLDDFSVRVGSGDVHLSLQDLPKKGEGSIKIGSGDVVIEVPKETNIDRRDEGWGKTEAALSDKTGQTLTMSIRRGSGSLRIKERL